MLCVGKTAILLLIINALDVHCKTILKTQIVNETDSLSLKKYERTSICGAKTCKNNGKCDVKGEGPDKVEKCDCLDPWTGDTCEESTCGDKTCKNNGKCDVTGEGAEKVEKCKCQDPWIGDTCEESICGAKTCRNNGKCYVMREGAEKVEKCICQDPWTGDTCEEKKCNQEVKCQNGGTCNTVTGKCYCLKGTTGLYCEVIEDCSTLNCEAKRAKCIFDTKKNAPTCECTDTNFYFEEEKCIEKCNKDDECYNGGVCDTETGRCYCAKGTYGGQCEEIVGCRNLDCERKNAECIFDITKHEPTCKCNNPNFYYEEEKCIRCDCGDAGKCSIVKGKKKCECPKHFIEDDGMCKECNCGDVGTCSIINGQKKCDCFKPYVDDDGTCKVCDCGESGVCFFKDGHKKCTCFQSTAELEGRCIGCNCGERGSCHFDSSGEKICDCFPKYAPYNGYCYKCDCGPNGNCSIDLGINRFKEYVYIQRCTCDENYQEKNGKCEYCSCGENSHSCRFTYYGKKECNCSSGYIQNSEYCEECNCGPYGSCEFQNGKKNCNCKFFAIEINGTCVDKDSVTKESSVATTTTVIPSTVPYCDCGKYSTTCHYKWTGEKICDCFPGYVDNYGKCDECNCGPYGSCSFKNGRKTCRCRPPAVENNGVCVDLGTSSTSNTTTTFTTVSSTVQDCYCGEYSKSCHYTWRGNKICDCFDGFADSYGTCKECDCGLFGNCTFEYGRKKCICNSDASEKNGKCEACYCGENSKSCRFDWKDEKVCNCSSGYAQLNGICEAICNEDKCLHGKCEIVGNTYKCRCKEGFTGQRCEEKIRTTFNKQDLWMVLILSAVIAMLILLSGMFCFWTRFLNRIPKK